MNKMKRIKITTIILAIILITMVAFAGLYIKTQNRMENKIKDYSLGKELKGERVVVLQVAKDQDITNTDNYEIVKNTIENRMKNLRKMYPNIFESQEYTISLDKENGTIIVELPEDNNTDTYVYYLTASGEVKIKEDGENGTELLSDSMIEKGLYTYTSNIEGQYQVFLDLYLTEDGQAKIKEIKNNYAVLADEIEEIEAKESAEENKTEENKTEESKKIAKLTIGDNEYNINQIEDNKIRLLIGAETSNSTYVNSYISQAIEATMLINSGKYPVKYELETNMYVNKDITNKQLINVAIFVAAILLIIFIIFVIRYKINGLLASISYIGFVSLFTLILRYANVNISIEGIGAFILALIINIRINQLILNKNKEKNDIKEAVESTYKGVFLKLVPIIIIVLTLCFTTVTNLRSFGMVMFWGLLLIAVYNAIVTKTLLKLRESK